MSTCEPPPLSAHPELDFDGRTYDPDQDHCRLAGQLGRVYNVMKDGFPHTLDELKAKCGGTDASISARIRDLRKAKFGAYEIISRRVRDGLWEYQLEV